MRRLRFSWEAFSLAAAVVFHLVVGWFWLTATPLQDIDLPDNVPPALPYSTLKVGLGPDEKEHYLMVRSLAEGKGLPAPDPARRRDDNQWVSYQAQHPPLAYFVLSLLLRVAGGMAVDIQWILLRLACLGWGALAVLGGGNAIQRAFPTNRLVGVAGPWTLAALPMLGHMNGCLSNEPQAAALAALAWWTTVNGVRAGRLTIGRAVVAGLLLGLAGLSRMTALVWLPGLAWMFWRHGAPRGKATVALALSGVLPLLPWLVWNQMNYGQPMIRTFDRPLFADGAGWGQLLAGGISPAGSGATLNLPTLLLWFAGCPWTPIWLIQFYLPGGPTLLALGLLMVELIVLALLANHASQCRRKPGADTDVVGRDLLRACALVLVACILGQWQQMLFSDWNVVFSNGRYAVAAAGSSGLLLVFAFGATLRSNLVRIVVALTLAGLLVGFDLWSVSLVRRFYRDNPTQDAVQPIERR